MADSIPVRRAEPDLFFAILVAFSLCALSFLLQGDIGLGLRDEGFLWYGAVHTAHGEVPLRDFRSYDPGRYLWCAAWMRIFGDGILAMRLACAIFQALGLTCGLLAARRAVESRWMLVPIGLLLLLWMYPSWKLFESSLAMAAVYLGVLLLEKPSLARHVAAGAFVGLAAFAGRNLGLYVAVAFAGLIALARFKLDPSSFARKLAGFALGIASGYAPMLAMVAFIPEFRAAFADSIRAYAGQSALNAPLPVPWPWTISLAGERLSAVLSGWSFGLCFLLLPAFYLVATAIVVFRRRESKPSMPSMASGGALLASSAFVGAAYAHHVSVRSDISHLAQCIHPLWLGLLALPRALGWVRPRTAVIGITVAALVVGALSIGRESPLALKVWPENPALVYVSCEVAGDRLWIERGEAEILGRVVKLVSVHVPPDEKIWLSSHLLSLYPMLRRRSPVWDIYPAWKASEGEERRMLGELTDVRWVLRVDEPSFNPGLALAQTHPRVWASLRERFEAVPVLGLPEGLHLLRKKRG